MGMITRWHAVDVNQVDAVAALDPDAFVDWLEPSGRGDAVLDLDKQWHALHGVLTGTAWDTDPPCGRAVLGGVEFGEDLGYGPPRLLGATEVAEVAAELDRLGVDGFAAAVSPEHLDALDVYPNGVDWGDPEEQEYLVESFEQLRAFYRQAADAGQALIIVIL
jgi:hypothetical protein